jgi:hypothetical protein
MDKVGQFLKTSDESYTITASGQRVNGTPLRAAFMNKKMSGSFVFETYLKRGNADGFGGLMIQDENGYYIIPYLLINAADSYYGVKVYSPDGKSWNNVVDQVRFGTMSNYDCYIRIEKRSKEIKCFWKDFENDPWTEIATYNASQDMFGYETFVGFSVCGDAKTNPAQYIFSNYILREIESPTLIILK